LINSLLKSPQRLFLCAMAVLAPLLGSATLVAQESVEKIMAVVGKEIVLKSDVEGQLEVLASRNPAIDKADPKIRQFVLDQLINERLIMTKAQEDTVEVLEEDITQRMEYQIQSMVQQFGSEKRIEDLYGMSMSKVRREFRDEIKKQLLVEKIRNIHFGNVKANRSDVESFYERYKDSIPEIHPRIDLYHIVRYVRASDEQSKDAFDLAIRVRDSIMKGGNFAEFAKKYSGDPGSAVHGGDLGFVEKGKFVPAFEASAYGLQQNEISHPVETPFGWHVIQLIDKTPTSINCRHILFKVGQSESDRNKAREALNEIRDSAKAGKDFEELAKTFSDEKETQGFGGSMGQIELERLPEDMRKTIEALPDGGVSEPMPYAADPTKPGYHIMFRKSLIPAHQASLETDYKAIEQMATFEKKQRLEQEWIVQLRSTLYWEQRDK